MTIQKRVFVRFSLKPTAVMSAAKETSNDNCCFISMEDK